MKWTGTLAIVALLSAAVVAVLIVKDRQAPDDLAPPDPPGRIGPGALPRLVDLGADYCMPCKMMAPVLEKLRAEYAGRLVVEVIDVNVDRRAAQEYGVRLIPTQVFLGPEGDELYRHEGFMSKEDILAKWEELGVDLAPRTAPGKE